jgi:hypothetical protein
MARLPLVPRLLRQQPSAGGDEADAVVAEQPAPEQSAPEQPVADEPATDLAAGDGDADAPEPAAGLPTAEPRDDGPVGTVSEDDAADEAEVAPEQDSPEGVEAVLAPVVLPAPAPTAVAAAPVAAAPAQAAKPPKRPKRRRRRPAPPPGELRRERRALLRLREERLRDLGGLALEMYRRDRFREDLVLERCAQLVGLEARIHELDALLGAGRGFRRSRGARCECGAPLLWHARFCANCGRPTSAPPTEA